jgi:hypothetical protein
LDCRKVQRWDKLTALDLETQKPPWVFETDNASNGRGEGSGFSTGGSSTKFAVEEQMKNTLSVLMVLALVCCASFAQMKDKSKRPSPPATAQCSFPDGKKITVDYSRPSVKGRKIYGGLVPYGQEWRTGANEATTFVTDTDVMVGDTKVPAGSYTLFTAPAEDAWRYLHHASRLGNDPRIGRDQRSEVATLGAKQKESRRQAPALFFAARSYCLS